MMAATKRSEQITGWVNPIYKIKERCRQLKNANHRMTESRIVELAVLKLLPELERENLPVREDPAPQELKEEIPG